MKRLLFLLLLLIGISAFSQTDAKMTLKDFVDGMRVENLKDAEVKVILNGKEVTDLEAVPFLAVINMAIKVTKNEDTHDIPPRPSITISIEPLDENLPPGNEVIQGKE
ncbi:hypothetical protein [Flavobacterium sp.]|uniref:hypothetical protein n=1 Tax=Flavobacterium sp. TaxID=239 RepID=UPI00260164EE|nr:hypothetical protein [Flavobacterium sp.]